MPHPTHDNALRTPPIVLIDGMMTFRQLFDLPRTPAPITSWEFSSYWFPEIAGLWSTDDAVIEQIVADGRIRISNVVDERYEGDRFATMSLLRFDGEPLLVRQEAGRGGRDHRRRWVLNRTQAMVAARYLASLMLSAATMDDSEEVVDPDELQFPERLLSFYGTDHQEIFGIPVAAKNHTEKSVMLMPNDRGLLGTFPHDQTIVLVQAGHPAPAEFIRRGGCVMRRSRRLTKHEIETENPRMSQHNEETGVGQVYLYADCARGDWPDPALIAVV